jgi:hypothetical protein
MSTKLYEIATSSNSTPPETFMLEATNEFEVREAVEEILGYPSGLLIDILSEEVIDD